MGRSRKPNTKVHYFSNSLKSKMNEIVNVRTVFIEAPSGYGKTTAVHEFFHSTPHGDANVLWFTAEEETAEKGWERFCGEIKKIDEKAGCQLLNLGFPDENTLGETSQIFRTLVCDAETFLVADNFHFLKNKIPYGVWSALVEHGGDKLHLIIIAQMINNKGSVIVGNSNVLFINSNDLRLSKQDVQEYYEKAGVAISKTQAETLEKYTEGWIVALYLQMINFIEAGEFSHSASIFSLIDDTVWTKLSEEQRDFLLVMSQFESFTAKQANYMLDSDITPIYAENLIKNTAFIRYDLSKHRYYPHSILLEFLKIKFEDKDEAYQKNVFYKSAEWCRIIGQDLMAFKFFYHIKDYEKILSLNLFDYELSQTDETGHYETVLDIASNCPIEIKCKYPLKLIQMALELFSAGMYEQSEQLCIEIQSIIENSELAPAEKNKLYGELMLLRSFSDFNDIEKMSKWHKQAYELMNGTAGIISMTDSWTFGSPSVLYMFHRDAGALENEVNCLKDCLPYYSKLTNGHGMGADIVMKAEMLLNQGQIIEAEILTHKAAYISEINKQESITLCCTMLLARIALLSGDVIGFDNMTAKMEAFLKNQPKKSNRMTIDLIRSFLSNCLNEPESAEEWLKNGDINQKRLFDAAIPFAQMVFLNNRLLAKENKQVLALSEEFLKISEMFHFLIPQIYIKIYLAAAYHSEGNNTQAIELIKSAYDLALPDKLFLPFAENSEFLGSLFSEAFTWHQKDLEQIQKLSEKYQKGKAVIHDKYYKKELPFGLSEREFEVANLVAIGFQNKEIAKKLFLSENTIKQYLKSIFQKLDINRRSDLRNIIL